LLIGNRLLRQALSSILRKTADTLVAGESTAPADLFALITPLEIGVILADSVISFPSDFHVINEMQRLYPNMKMVMIGMELNESTFLTAVRAGVSGYLLNDASAAELIRTIRAVMRGEAICPPLLCSALFKAIAQEERLIPTQRTGPRLTRRQQELVPMIARGLTNKEIASHLNLSEQTIKNHIHRILRRVGANDRFEVVERIQHLN
jgi:two-component system, NarL family, nitrate/nitrite response regulator NarL